MSKNISSPQKILKLDFNARKLSWFTNRIQVFYLDKKGVILDTCQGLWKLDRDTSFFELFPAFQAHREAIEFMFEEAKINEEKKLSITELKISFEEENFILDALFSIKKQGKTVFLECLIEDKTEYYQTIRQLEEEKKLQEIEFLNEKWQLDKEKDILETGYQKDLQALDEQTRLDWTNTLSTSLKKIVTQYFLKSDAKDVVLQELSTYFEKISGLRLFPEKISTIFSRSDKKKVGYLGKNPVHEQLIAKLTHLAGGNFEAFDEIAKAQHSDTDFIFVEEAFITWENKKENQNIEILLENHLLCLLVEETFLESKQDFLVQKSDKDIALQTYPLFPFQIWQQLLSFTNTTIMNYHEKIDLSQIYDMVDNEPILVQNMLQILDKNLREYPSQIQKEFNEGELDTLRQTIHKFKSCTAYTGLTEFNTTLSEIEASRENGWTIAQIKEKLDYILQAIPVIKVQVEEKLRAIEQEMS